LREELRLGMFENRLLRKIFGPKNRLGKRDWRRLRIEELYDLHCAENVIRIIKSKVIRRGESL
jgi:hypothetical protein